MNATTNPPPPEATGPNQAAPPPVVPAPVAVPPAAVPVATSVEAPPPATPERPPYPAVTLTDRFVDAAYTSLRHYFAEFTANEPGTRVGEDPEPLHDMRVASRRLRVALRVFRDALPPRQAESFRRDLRRIGLALGEARDADVYLAWLDAEARQLPDSCADGMAIYRRHVVHQRDRARARMLRVLDSRGQARFVARFRTFLEAGPPRRLPSPAAAFPVRYVFPELFERRLRRAVKRGRELTPEAGDADCHRLRIQLKKLRYLGEFFRAAYAGKAMLRFHARLVAIQDALGSNQDCVAGRARLDRFLARRPHARDPGLYLALGMLFERNLRTVASARQDFFKEWAQFAAKKQLRKVLAAVRG